MKIEEILRSAKDKNASDIHVQSDYPMMFRIDGEMVPQTEEAVTLTDMETLLVPLMTAEQKQTLDTSGELDFAFSLPGFSRVRINAFRQRGAYAASLRMLSFDIPTPEELALPKDIVNLTEKKKGLVLVTGGAGSGKSTTLASLIDVIARRDAKNIITIEDPIEYLHSFQKSIVSQREIGGDTGNYATALRAALRQDPDVIYVGDMIDIETIAMAITAAEAGHLVFASLYTNKASDTIHRLIDVFPTHQQQQIRVQLADVMEGIITQQLLPRCDMDGRTAVFEILLADAGVRKAVREDKISQISTIIEDKSTMGMQTMDGAILGAYMKSWISSDTAIAFAQDPEGMQKRVRIY